MRQKRRHTGADAALKTISVEDFFNFQKPAVVIAADQIQDPQNLGAIIRSLYALGGDGILITVDQSSPVTAAVNRASAGAAEHLPIAQVANLGNALKKLKEQGYWVLAAMPGEKSKLQALNRFKDERLVIVLGNEFSGIRPSIVDLCDEKVSIPMARPFDSLNVSVSAAILLYELKRHGHENERGVG